MRSLILLLSCALFSLAAADHRAKTPLMLLEKRAPKHPAHQLGLKGQEPLNVHTLITDRLFLSKLSDQQKNQLISYRDTLAANLRASGHPKFPAPSGYQRQSHKGWGVFIHDTLLKKHPKETLRALHLLDYQLQDIIDRVPAPAVSYLKKVPLYFSPSDIGHGGACHHPSSQWLKNNNRPLEMAKTIEFSNILNFEKETRRMPNFALHELAHAYHNHLLGDQHPTILKAYHAAKKSEKFTNLPKRTGDLKKPLTSSKGPTYAMTNQMEYFAETTEAYFTENDITPYNRASLREMDPKVIPLLEKIWGVKKSKHPLLAADRILFLGDSITASRDYVIDLQAALHLHGHVPEIIASGLGSEGVTGLSEPRHPFPRPSVHERLSRALEKVKPDLIIACYGMNDGIYYPFSPDRFAAYQQGLQKLIDASHAAGAKIILVTPPPFDVQAHKEAQSIGAKEFHWGASYRHYDRDVIAPYARWVMAQKSQVTRVVDVHSPITAHYAAERKKDKTYALSKDGIHINRDGHRLLAQLIYKELFGKPMPALADELVEFYTKRQSLLAPAWLSHIGHNRPSVKDGLPLDQAQAKAAATLR